MHYVLDLDDTLYLERDYVRSGFKAVGLWLSVNMHFAGFFDDAWRLFKEGARGNIFDDVLTDHNIIQPGLVNTLVEVYRSHEPEISLLPDAAEFLRQHVQSSLALITDGHSVAQWKKIKALKLVRFVSQVIVTGDWGIEFWKPHTRAFREIMKGRDARECLYIADNPKKDFIAPSTLGWAPSIRMRRHGGLHYDLQTPDTVTEISSFTELLR